MRACGAAVGLLLTMAAPLAAQNSAPLSAIDWLSNSVTAPQTLRPRLAPPRPSEPAIAGSALPPVVTVTPLNAPSPDRIGLLGPATTGLPATLWSGSSAQVLVSLMRADAMPTLPAIRDFRVVLMLARAEPPLGAGSEGALFLARVDGLLALGALDQAQALLEEADPTTTALFRRWFDVALLTGTEGRACDVMKRMPGIAPTTQARVFCLARAGDWSTAALTLNTARVLGDLPPDDVELLTRFLDPELFADEADLPLPAQMTPLTYRLREAIGLTMSTSSLPLAFSHADLRDTVGWKAQLDAAERLARAGALPAATLRALFTSRRPSASGGVWERVEAFQRFDVAIQSGDPGAVASTLPLAWEAMSTMRAELPFAQLYADRLARLPLNGPAADIALTVGLLSPNYEAIANAASAGDPFLLDLAKGTPENPKNGPQNTVFEGFSSEPPADLMRFVTAGQLGEGLLRAMATFSGGLANDPRRISEALAFFRAVGLEDLARRAALQYLLLERPV